MEGILKKYLLTISMQNRVYICCSWWQGKRNNYNEESNVNLKVQTKINYKNNKY